MTAHSLVLAAVSPQLAKLLGADAADPEGDGAYDGADNGGKVNEDCDDDSDDRGNTDVRQCNATVIQIVLASSTMFRGARATQC